MQNKLIEKLDSKCRQIGAYLIVLRSQGPFASMQVCSMPHQSLSEAVLADYTHIPHVLQISGPELCVIETKPDTTPSDLRLSTAWPDLLSLANEVDLDSCDDIVHKHTPWGMDSSHSYSCMLQLCSAHISRLVRCRLCLVCSGLLLNIMGEHKLTLI